MTDSDSRTAPAGPETRQDDTASAMARAQRLRLWSRKRLPPGPAILIMVLVALALWAGIFWLARAL